MHHAYLLLGLLILVCLLPRLAKKVGAPLPIMLFMAGIGIGFIPGLEWPHPKPDMILPFFLPPLLVGAAYYTSFRDFRRNLRPILLLAFGLVIATTLAMGYAMPLLVPGMPVAVGMVLGAVVSPPDAVAATSLFKHLRVPKRVVTILEGESLVNDATALLLYQTAIAAVVAGSFEPWQAGAHFGWLLVGGIGLGLLFGWGSMWIFPHLRDLRGQILFTFVVPYLAYFIAEDLHSSGVLAVVTMGLVIGWMAPKVFTPVFRIPSEAVWGSLIHTLTSLVFLLVGMVSSDIFQIVAERYAWLDLLRITGLSIFIIVLVRFLWIFILTFGLRQIVPHMRRHDPFPSWQNVALIGWCGMRGVVSLATALAIPLTVAHGENFPYRDLVLFISVCFIFFSLVVQGGTLPWLIGKLNLRYDPQWIQEDWKARHIATEGAMAAIKKLQALDGPDHPALTRIHSYYTQRLSVLGDGPHSPLSAEDSDSEKGRLHEHPVLIQERKIWKEVLESEREAILGLRREWKIGDEVMHDLLREIDMLAQRFAPETTP